MALREDVNSKLAEVVTVVDVDYEDYVGKSLFRPSGSFCLWTKGIKCAFRRAGIIDSEGSYR